MNCVNSISVCPKTISLGIGHWYYSVNAEVCSNSECCQEVIWQSENPLIASVNEKSGYIYGVSLGTTRIYAQATDDSGCCDFITVTVKEKVPVETIKLNRYTVPMSKGQTCTLSAEVFPETATQPALRWTSSKNSVATVENGVVTAITNGNATITASATDGSGIYAICRIRVSGVILAESVTIVPEQITIGLEEFEMLQAIVSPADADNKKVSWESNNRSIATVNAGSGLIHAVSLGETDIVATAQDGSEKSATCHVTVRPVPVESLELCPRHQTLRVNQFSHVNAAICPEHATNKEIHWDSSDSSIVFVDNEGSLKALKNGTAFITARTQDGNMTDTVCVTVDSRKRATVCQDDFSFYVEFEDEPNIGDITVWKHVGSDLGNFSESGKTWPPQGASESELADLNTEERRAYDNTQINFSPEQLGYLYLLDPLGVKFYLKSKKSGRENLPFIDSVYEAIYGTQEREHNQFFFSIHGGQEYYVSSAYGASHRNEIYSKAEVMLTNPRAKPDLDSIMPTLLENLFNFIRDIPIVGTVISLGEALFHTRSVTGIVTDQVASYLSSYAQEQVEKAISNRFGNLVKTPIHWAFTLLSILKDPISEIFRAPNPQDTSIYDHVKAQPQYLTVFYNGKNNPTILDVAYVANENKSKEES